MLHMLQVSMQLCRQTDVTFIYLFSPDETAYKKFDTAFPVTTSTSGNVI